MSRPVRPDALPLRLGEYVLRRACRMMANSGRAMDKAAEREELERDWCTELAAVHSDPDFPSALARTSTTLRYAFGLFWYATRASAARDLSDDGRYARSGGNPMGVVIGGLAVGLPAGAVGAAAGGISGAFTGGPMGAFVGFWLGGLGSLFGGFLLMAAYVHGSSRVSIRALLTLLSPLPFWVLGPLVGVAVGAPLGAPTGFLAALHDGAVGGIATILFMAAMVVISITEGRRSLNA